MQLTKISDSQKREDNSICAIVIPVYKEQIDKYEELSFRQCLKILHKYDIYLVTHQSLNLAEYTHIAKDYNIQLRTIFFSGSFFTGIAGYNRLMKSKNFYRSFSEYENILVYQLDAFVFRDELNYWCSQGYDYIGAPWFNEFKEKDESNSLWKVGNGGLSLRKVSYFIKVLSWKLPLMNWIWVCSMGTISLLKKPFYICGWKNNIDYYVATELKMNEDVFFTTFLQSSYIPPILPDVEIAARFAFEKSPRWLYNYIGERLPFGCHGFLKNEYDSFWNRFIKTDETLHNNNQL